MLIRSNSITPDGDRHFGSTDYAPGASSLPTFD
jgi:hypothetical protein